MLMLGIDIGGSSVKVAAMEDRRTIWTHRSDTYDQPDLAALVTAIRIAANGGELSKLSAVGLCVPGLLDARNRRITLSANVPGLVGVPLWSMVEDALGKRLERPPQIVNDAYATAHDIVMHRNLRGRVVVVALGTGVGLSVLDDGVPLIVEGSGAGHIGQIDVSLDHDPPVGPDGGAGGLEGYIGAAALEQAYGSVSAALSVIAMTDPPICALVRTIRIAHAIYRPHSIVLAGGIGLRLRRLLSDIRHTVATRLTSVARAGWTLTTADHDFHAACGAADLATQWAMKTTASFELAWMNDE